LGFPPRCRLRLDFEIHRLRHSFELTAGTLVGDDYLQRVFTGSHVAAHPLRDLRLKPVLPAAPLTTGLDMRGDFLLLGGFSGVSEIRTPYTDRRQSGDLSGSSDAARQPALR
jgi:hypothetical protein